ncbi:MAG TPA: dienelactone hydrolase family protein [Sphingomicrobium sp.]|nr:dienelactone hydrolase family protein [Sphingomicrobium sp.]
MDRSTRQRAIELYDRFTHEGMERRSFMARMVALAGSAAAAEALIASIAASPAAAAVVPADDPRLTTRTQKFGNGYSAYVAEPRTRSLKPTVLVIHENRGLNDHIRDVARRAAIAGYRAVAPDILSPVGGTPADEDAAREAIGKLDLGEAVAAGVAIAGELASSSRAGKIGAVGFCWGGGYVNRLAVAAGDKLHAGVPFYGPAPGPADAAKVSAPMQFHLAGLDKRVAETAWPWIGALASLNKPVEAFSYSGANHAFHNDASAERYDKAAATLAWQRTVDFFARHLGA